MPKQLNIYAEDDDPTTDEDEVGEETYELDVINEEEQALPEEEL